MSSLSLMREIVTVIGRRGFIVLSSLMREFAVIFLFLWLLLLLSGVVGGLLDRTGRLLSLPPVLLLVLFFSSLFSPLLLGCCRSQFSRVIFFFSFLFFLFFFFSFFPPLSFPISHLISSARSATFFLFFFFFSFSKLNFFYFVIIISNFFDIFPSSFGSCPYVLHIKITHRPFLFFYLLLPRRE